MNYFEDEFYKKLFDVFKNDGAFKGKTKELLYNEEIREIAKKYTLMLISEQEPIRRWGSNPENYYYQMAVHCHCAGLSTASWWLSQGTAFNANTVYEALTTMDSIVLAQSAVPIKDKFALDMNENIRFSQFLEAIKGNWNGKIENRNTAILSGLILFFMAGATEELSRFE